MKAGGETRRQVYFVGAPWSGHAAHSGYEVFCDLVGTKLWRFPVRTLPGFVGKIIDRLTGRVVGRKYYTFGNLLTELYALAHLAVHPRAHYHVLYGDSDTVLLPAAVRRLRRSASATVHLPAYRLPAEFGYESLRGFETVVFLAEVHRAVAGAEMPWAHTAVVHHPVDTEFFCPGELGATPSRPRQVLTVGGHLRDFATLVTAVDKLIANDIVDELVAVGVPADERRHFAALLRTGHARLCEHVDDVELRHLYRQATVVILSLDDAYANNALLEAMACGCLIVASDVGAVAEYLGDAGRLCAPHDPNGLADAVAEALRDPHAVEEQRRAARERAAQFDRHAMAARFRTETTGAA